MVKLSIDMSDYTNPKSIFRHRFLAVIVAIAFLLSLLPVRQASAQATSYPEYEVLSGDTLSWIALRFDSTLEQ